LQKRANLGATSTASNVESNDLGTNQVVARGDVRRDIEEDFATVSVHLINTPLLASLTGFNLATAPIIRRK
jgi:hypothetical protein